MIHWRFTEFFVWLACSWSATLSLRVVQTFQLRANENNGTGKTLHSLRSDPIQLVDTKTLRIPNLYYSGKGPDTYWMVGTGDPPVEEPTSAPGTKIPNERGSCAVLKAYKGETIQLVLPGHLSINTIDWLAVFCLKYRHTFGWADLRTPRGGRGKRFLDVPKANKIPPPPLSCAQLKLQGYAKYFDE